MTETASEAPSWEDAACRTNPRGWTDVDDPVSASHAVQLCETCPVLAACERMRADFHRRGLPIAGVVAGRMPFGPLQEPARTLTQCRRGHVYTRGGRGCPKCRQARADRRYR